MSKVGRGIAYLYEDGGTYCGEWEKDCSHGYGCGTGPGGVGEFAGRWEHGSQVCGTYTWPEGMKYMGEWKSNQRDGLGKETREDGTEYSGAFAGGARGPYGVIKLANGTYSGSWRSGKQEGEGKEVYLDQGCYRGQYKNGMRLGFGTRTSAAYELREKEGSSIPPHHSMPTLFDPQTCTKKSSISSTVSLPPKSGLGIPEGTADCIIYEGEWKNDKRHGYGVIKCIGVYTYYGQWFNNMQTGYGVKIYENGVKEEGEWHNGQLVAALKRKKLQLKSQKLETQVQMAHTQAIQAMDTARSKSVLAESRTASAYTKAKMALATASEAEESALIAKEKYEMYRNGPKISETASFPLVTNPCSWNNRKPSSGQNSPSISRLGISSSSIAHSPSFENLRTLHRPPLSKIVSDSDSDSEEADSGYSMQNLPSRSDTPLGQSSSESRVRRRMAYDMEGKSHSLHSYDSDDLMLKRPESNMSIDFSIGSKKVFAAEAMTVEEENKRKSVKRLMKRRRRDKTTGEELADHSTTDDETPDGKKTATLPPKPHPLVTRNSVAMDMLVNNLNQMVNWNKMIAYVNFFLLLFLMALIVMVVISMYYYQFVSFLHNHSNPEDQRQTTFISPIA